MKVNVTNLPGRTSPLDREVQSVSDINSQGWCYLIIILLHMQSAYTKVQKSTHNLIQKELTSLQKVGLNRQTAASHRHHPAGTLPLNASQPWSSIQPLAAFIGVVCDCRVELHVWSLNHLMTWQSLSATSNGSTGLVPCTASAWTWCWRLLVVASASATHFRGIVMQEWNCQSSHLIRSVTRLDF